MQGKVAFPRASRGPLKVHEASCTATIPWLLQVRDTLFPFWYEIVSVAWYAGLLLAQITNPGAKGGLAWVKPLIVSLGVIVVIVHLSVCSRHIS